MAVYVCRRCGAQQDRPWEGQCPSCGGLYRWRKVGVDSAEQKAYSSFAGAVRSKVSYVSTGVKGFDDVFGGGVVDEKVILLGGFPGAGKSTLLCMLADSIARVVDRPVIYANGEGSEAGVLEIANRLGLSHPNVKVLGNQRSVEKVLAVAEELKAFLTIYDSAQKFASDSSGGMPGSIQQCKAMGEMIARQCQRTKTCAIIVNQMSSTGDLKGGTELEHHCDAVAVLAPPKPDDEEAPEEGNVRILVNSKNRFGPENLKTYWRMTEAGVLEQVPPRSRIIEFPSRGKYSKG